MKKSNLILLILLVVTVIGIAGVITASRVISAKIFTAYERGELEGKTELDGSVLTQKHSIKDFNGISTGGIWDVEIARGAGYKVEIIVSQYLADKIIVEKRGEVLHLDLKPEISDFNTRTMLKAVITMPDLILLESSGASSIRFIDFDMDSLSVSVSGGSHIISNDCSINDLLLDCSGAAKIDFEGSRIQNADLDISGAAAIELNMTGGALTGSISGAASVVYYGKVSSESIETSGVGSVKHR